MWIVTIQTFPVQETFGVRLNNKQHKVLTDWELIFINSRYRSTVLLLTFLAYVFYNVARKSISVVKTELVVCNETITIDIDETVSKAQEPVCSSWIGILDTLSTR